MLLTKIVNMKWNNANRKIYEPKGYKFTRIGDIFKLNVSDLSENSHVYIEFACDYCLKEGLNSIKQIKFQAYQRNRKIVDTDCCDNKKCKHLKHIDIMNKKQELKLLDINTNGYWMFEENILKELKEYIDNFKTIDNMQNKKPNGSILYSNIKAKGFKLEDLISKLGMDIKDLTKTPTTYIYKDKNSILEEFKKFISKNNRFPTYQDINSDMPFSSSFIAYTFKDGIQEIKRILNFKDENDLLDNNNYYNASKGEYIISQWLISQGITYDRNVKISNESKHNCDWVTQPIKDNGEIDLDNQLWIEYWGGLQGQYYNGVYKKKYDKKIQLYTKYNKNLVSIYPSEFDRLNYDKKQEYLYNIFKDHIKLKYKKINNELIQIPNEKIVIKNSKKNIKPTKELTDYELISALLMKNDILPNTKYIKKNKLYRYYDEILKRYKSYQIFADKYNMTVDIISKNNYWDDNKVLEKYNYMLNSYGYILNNKEILNIKDENLSGLTTFISRSNKENKGIYYYRILLYNECIKNNITIPKKELDFLYNMINNNYIIKNLNDFQRKQITNIHKQIKRKKEVI